MQAILQNQQMQIVIHGELHSSKNSRRIIRARGRQSIVKSERAKEDEDTLLYQLNAHRVTWKRMTENLQFPIRVSIKFFRKTKAKFDYNNMSQGLADAMVKAGYLPDDDANHLIPVFEPYGVDGKMPRTVLTIAKETQKA